MKRTARASASSEKVTDGWNDTSLALQEFVVVAGDPDALDGVSADAVQAEMPSLSP